MRTLTFLLFLSLPSWAAFGVKTAWEVQTGGADTNGGGFDSGNGSCGTDQSVTGGQAYTDIIVGATTTQGTSVLHAFTSTTNGPCNFIRIASGTGCTVQWVEMTSQSGGTATFDKSLGTAASVCTGQLGNPLATPGIAASLMVGGNTAWVKNGTYSISSSTVNIAGGPPNPPAGTAAAWTIIQGYTTTRGDLVTRSKLQATVANPWLIDAWTGSPTQVAIVNLELDCNSQSSTRGLMAAAQDVLVFRVDAHHCTTTGIYAAEARGTLCLFCSSHNNTGSSGSRSTLLLWPCTASSSGTSCPYRYFR